MSNIELGHSPDLTKTEKKAIKGNEKMEEIKKQEEELNQSNEKLVKLLDSLPFVKMVKERKTALRIEVMSPDGQRCFVFCPEMDIEHLTKFIAFKAGNAITVKESMKMIKSEITNTREAKKVRTGTLISVDTYMRVESIVQIEVLEGDNKEDYSEMEDIINSFYPAKN